MKVYPVRNSFNSGEVSELTEFRDDIAKYGGACSVLENAFPLVEGGATKMPGTFYAGGSKYGGDMKHRLVPFSRTTGFGNYILEFGQAYIRFWTTGPDPGVILAGSGLPYEVATPYSVSDLFDLDVDTQSADVLYIYHHLYPPMTLNHYGDASWTLTPLAATGTLDAATSSSGIPKPITAITNSSPAIVTCQGHGFATGSQVYINHVVGMVEVNYKTFTVTGYGTVVSYDPSLGYAVGKVVSVGSYAAVDVINGKYLYVATPFMGTPSTMPLVTVLSNSADTLAVAFATGTLTIKLANATPSKNSADLIQVAVRALTATGMDFTLWTVTEDEAYSSARPTTGISGVSVTMVLNDTYYTCLKTIASSATNTNHFPPAEALWWNMGAPVGDPVNQFALNGIDSTAFTAYISGGTAVQVVPLFAAAGDYPSCGALYEQRLFVGGSDNNPNKFWGSVVGDYPNFISDPEVNDYAVIFTLVSQKVDQILNMVASPNALLMGTASGIWSVTGSNNATLSATSINASKQTTIGEGKVRPQLLNDSVIFISNSGRIALFLVYNFVTNQWDNYDLTRLNRSITIGTSAETSGIVQTGFQAEPYPIFWGVRRDGQLLGLVFNKQDQVFAWFRVNMLPQGGVIESVAVISQDSDEDQVWISVSRTAGHGAATRGNEYFAPHELFGQLSNSFFVHCGLQNTFAVPTYTVSGLSALSGQQVVAVGDGSKLAVKGQPVFRTYGDELTFDTPAKQITIGIPYTQTVQPANLVVSAGGGTSRGMKQKLRRVTLSIFQGIGGKYGTDPDYMYSIPYGESYLGNPPVMYSGEVTVDCDCDWDAQSKLIITNDEPFPFTLRGLVARLEFNPD